MGSRRRFASLALLLVLAITVVALGGCSGGEKDASGEPAAERYRARVSGSGTCLPLLKIMTKAYGPKDIDFVYLPGLHSGGGIQGVAGGDLEIGAVSRELNDEEQDLGLQYTLLSTDGLVIAVHESVNLDGLTTQQVKDIYAGKHKNWKELGGPDLAITILDRNEDESAKIILRQYVIGKDLKISDRAVSLYYESDMVEGLEGTPGSIGYFSLGYGVSQGVKARFLKLDDVAPTAENITNGTYKVIRPLGIVTKKDAPASVQNFLKWATSSAAKTLIEGEGYAPAK